MKKLKYILIALIFMFVGISGVSAKEVEKTCLYQGIGAVNPYPGAEGDILDSQANEVTISIYTDGSANAKISIKSGLPYNETEQIDNWVSGYDCYDYILLYYNSHFVEDFAFLWDKANIYVSNSKDELINIANEKGWALDEDAFIIAGHNRTVDLTEREEAYKYIEAAITNLQNVNLTVASCKKEDDLSKCELKYNSVNSMVGEYYQNVSIFITSSVIPVDDERVKTFKSLYEKTVKELSKFHDEIKEAQKQIDTGYEPDDEVIVDPNYKYGCKIFGDTIVELIREIYGYFKWIIPLLIIILSMLDFVKVVGTGKDDDFKKAQNNLIKRIVLGVVFFLIPTVISFIIGFSGITEQFTNGDSILEAVTCILK